MQSYSAVALWTDCLGLTHCFGLTVGLGLAAIETTENSVHQIGPAAVLAPAASVVLEPVGDIVVLVFGLCEEVTESAVACN